MTTHVAASPLRVVDARAGAEVIAPADDGIGKAARSGWLIIGFFFGVLGLWSMFAPLDGAVLAQAEVRIDGNHKSIQHLEGGIVKELLVREGDRVTSGQTLLVLEDTQARTEFDVLDQLATALLLADARLRLEQEGGSALIMPESLATRAGEPAVQTAWRGQIAQLEARRREDIGQREIVVQRIAQLESQIKGAEAQLASLRSQRQSLDTEHESLKPLLEKGIVTRARLVQLERSISVLDGQIGEAVAGISRSQQAIAEQHQIDAQVRNQRITSIAQERRDVQMRLAEVVPKLANARAIRERTIVRAPYAGRVIGLSVFSVGAVIGRGDKLMDIVPEGQALIVEGRIPVEDVGDVRPNSPAEVRLTGYKQQVTPPLHGRVTRVSADRLSDQRTGAPFYAATIRIDDDNDIAASGIRLQPGMPATVTIPTTSRTALQYLVSPLRTSLNAAFREK